MLEYSAYMKIRFNKKDSYKPSKTWVVLLVAWILLMCASAFIMNEVFQYISFFISGPLFIAFIISLLRAKHKFKKSLLKGKLYINVQQDMCYFITEKNQRFSFRASTFFRQGSRILYESGELGAYELQIINDNVQMQIGNTVNTYGLAVFSCDKRFCVDLTTIGLGPQQFVEAPEPADSD